jgi:hypothetical protein
MVTIKKQEKGKISKKKYCCREPESQFPVVYHCSNRYSTKIKIQEELVYKDQFIADL